MSNYKRKMKKPDGSGSDQEQDTLLKPPQCDQYFPTYQRYNDGLENVLIGTENKNDVIDNQSSYNDTKLRFMRFFYFILFICASCFSSALFLVVTILKDDNLGMMQEEQGHKHVIPTLLSTYTRHQDEIVLANAIENQAYDLLLSMENFVTDEKMLSESIDLNKNVICFGESLELTWTSKKSTDANTDEGKFFSNSRVLSEINSSQEPNEKDIFALYCPAGVDDHRNFKDAATIY